MLDDGRNLDSHYETTVERALKDNTENLSINIMKQANIRTAMMIS